MESAIGPSKFTSTVLAVTLGGYSVGWGGCTSIAHIYCSGTGVRGDLLIAGCFSGGFTAYGLFIICLLGLSSISFL